MNFFYKEFKPKKIIFICGRREWGGTEKGGGLELVNFFY